MNNYSGLVQRADGEFVQLLMHNDAVNKEGFHVCARRSSNVMSSAVNCGDTQLHQLISGSLFFSEKSKDSFSFQIFDGNVLRYITKVTWKHFFHIDTSAGVTYGGHMIR